MYTYTQRHHTYTLIHIYRNQGSQDQHNWYIITENLPYTINVTILKIYSPAENIKTKNTVVDRQFGKRYKNIGAKISEKMQETASKLVETPNYSKTDEDTIVTKGNIAL